MSQGNQSCLRFSLEESVWFQRGQEVAELVSISLNPNISIQEMEQYVTIQGSLELTGEYNCFEANQDVVEGDLQPHKFVQSVLEREEGVYEFLHRFPVDITIPKNRIESIDEIDIYVETFDYVLPEKDRLKLSADLAITGLFGEQQHGTETVNENHHFDELEISYREEDVEKYEEVDQDDFPETPLYSFVQQPEVLKEYDQEEYEDQIYAPFKAEANKTAFEQEALQWQRPNPPIPEYAGNEFRNDQLPVEENLNANEQSEYSEETNNEQAEAAEESSSSSEEVVKKKKPNMKKGISIAEFLARKEECEVAKIKVCIVQQGDTLELISERYDVPVQQILKVNHLSIDHEVHEGQVLYVPSAFLQNH